MLCMQQQTRCAFHCLSSADRLVPYYVSYFLPTNVHAVVACILGLGAATRVAAC